MAAGARNRGGKAECGEIRYKEIEGRKRAEFTRGGCGLKMGLRRALRACVVVADATRGQILQTYDRFVLSYEKIEPD